MNNMNSNRTNNSNGGSIKLSIFLTLVLLYIGILNNIKASIETQGVIVDLYTQMISKDSCGNYTASWAAQWQKDANETREQLDKISEQLSDIKEATK